MKVKIDQFFLAEGNKNSPINLKVSGQRATQIANFFRGESIKAYPRSNRQTTVSFDVSREWDSINAAAEFMIMHDSDVPENGDVAFISDDPSGTIVRYIKNAVVQTVSGEQTGVTTKHSYVLVGGKATVK